MCAKLQNYLLEKQTESRKTRAYKVIRYNILDNGLVSLLLWITKTEVLEDCYGYQSLLQKEAKRMNIIYRIHL